MKRGCGALTPRGAACVQARRFEEIIIGEIEFSHLYSNASAETVGKHGVGWLVQVLVLTRPPRVPLPAAVRN